MLDTLSAFLDLKKSFDSVKKDFLLYKVNKMFFSVKSFCENAKTCAKVCLPRHLVFLKEKPSCQQIRYVEET